MLTGASIVHFVLVSVAIISGPAYGQSLQIQQKQTACLYDVNLDFLYLAEAEGFSSGKAAVIPNEVNLAGAAEGGNVRTLGLNRAIFNFEWTLPRGVGVQIALRPDAIGGNGGPVVRELDVRSGRVIEPMPSIHLLDEYRISIKKPSVEVYLGVEDSVLESIRVTPEVLGFGLWVRGPEKSMAVGFSAPKLVTIGNSQADDSLGFGLSLLSGRDERHDARTAEPAHFGESPSKRDPYWGGAAKFGARVLSGSKVVVSAAMIEERQDGAVTRIQWYQAGVRRSVIGSSLAGLLVAMEVRQLRESFKQESTEISDVSLNSVGITSSVILDAENSVLLGFWSGVGEIHPDGSVARSLAAKGVQAELGWRWSIEEQLELVAVGSREWRRDAHDVGGTIGGFPHGDGRRSAQSRIAIQLNYKLGGQI